MDPKNHHVARNIVSVDLIFCVVYGDACLHRVVILSIEIQSSYEAGSAPINQRNVPCLFPTLCCTLDYVNGGELLRVYICKFYCVTARVT